MPMQCDINERFSDSLATPRAHARMFLRDIALRDQPVGRASSDGIPNAAGRLERGRYRTARF